MSNDKISSNVKLGLRSNKRAQRPATYAADIDVPVKLLYEVSNLGAVSYTHLDVYKRQDMGI